MADPGLGIGASGSGELVWIPLIVDPAGWSGVPRVSGQPPPEPNIYHHSKLDHLLSLVPKEYGSGTPLGD